MFKGGNFRSGYLDPMQDCNSLCVEVVIWAADIITQTHIHRQTNYYVRLDQPDELRKHKITSEIKSKIFTTANQIKKTNVIN